MNMSHLQNFRREFERIFGDFSRYWPTYSNGGWRGSATTGFLSPRANISESSTALEINIELPGVKESDIDIEINDDQANNSVPNIVKVPRKTG